jgi:peroxiredoxin
MKRLFSIAIMIALLVYFNAGCQSTQNGASPGNRAPDFELAVVNGQSVKLSALEGRPVVLNFWQLSCPYCIEEMAYFQQLFELSTQPDESFYLVSVNSGDSPISINKYLNDNNYTFKVLLDSQAKTANQYGLSGVPATFFIDRNGIIREVVLGPFSDLDSIMNKLEAIN